MGQHCVAVLFNDFCGEIECEGGKIGPRMSHAMANWNRVELNGFFRVGRVLSRDHSTGCQIVFTKDGHGSSIYDAHDLPDEALRMMAECLIRHGWRAARPIEHRKPKGAQGIETRRAETSEAQAPSRSDESPVAEGDAPITPSGSAPETGRVK